MRTSIFPRYGLLILIALLTGCATFPDNSGRNFSYAVNSNDTQSAAAALLEHGENVPANESGFLLLSDGHDDFVARMILAERAERSIDLQTFIFADDLIGHSTLDSLLKAANRGVRVRLLLDDVGVGARDNEFAAFDAHPNIEIRLFNPLKRGQLRGSQYVTGYFFDITRRMHNKTLIIDNQVAIVGGRNISNDYFGARAGVSFHDLDAIAVGPVVQEVSKSFDAFWNHKLAYPISILDKHPPSAAEAKTIIGGIALYAREEVDSDYANALRNSGFIKKLRSNSLDFIWGNARVVADSPDKILAARKDTDLQLAIHMEQLFKDAKSEVIIVSPYFIPGKDGTAGLIELEKSGVHVRVLTNSLASNDHAMVHAFYAKYRKKMLAAGIEIYELRNDKQSKILDVVGDGTLSVGSENQGLHAKFLVFDRLHSFVGSMNMDPRSWVENTEIGIVFESEIIGEGIAEWFNNEMPKTAYHVKLENKPGSKKQRLVWISDDGTKVYKEPDSTFGQRFSAGFYRMIPMESQL